MKDLRAIVIGIDNGNTLNVIRSLGQDGIKVYAVIISSVKQSFALKSKYLCKGLIVGSLSVAFLKNEFANTGCRIPILPASDGAAAFIDSNYDELSKYFILPSVNNKGGELVKEMAKSLQLKHAAIAGFDIPQSVTISLEDLDAAKNKIADVRFPCIIKPEQSINGCKNDFRICHSKTELIDELSLLSRHMSSNVLIQDFIANNEVILVAGLRTNDGRNFIFGEINKIKHSKNVSSLGLNCVGVLSQESELSQYCTNYVESINYHGFYSMDVVRLSTDSRRFNYFMEVNLRTDGLLYIYTKGGINYPALWVKSCYGEEVEEVEVNIKRNVCGMDEFLYLQESLSASSIKDFFKTDVFTFFSFRDPKPFIHRFLFSVKYHLGIRN